GADLRAPPRRARARDDDPPRRPEHRQGRGGVRLPLSDRAGHGGARRAARRVRGPHPRDHPRRVARDLTSAVSFPRRVVSCVIVYAALAWLPWALSEYHTHVLVMSLSY